MRDPRDTFLHFLNDNLQGLPVHNIRMDPNNTANSILQMEAVNVQFITDTPRIDVSTLTVTIDVVNAAELDAVDAMTKVWKLLSISGYVPLMTYSNTGSAPIEQRCNLSWDVKQVRFRPLYSGTYSHYTCLLTLSYVLF